MDLTEPVPLRELYISGIIRETPNTKSFILKSKSEDIPYQAGQFLTFIFQGTTENELRRSYSMSSSPLLGEPLTITVNRIDNGEISRLLHDRTQEGDVLHTIGASGFFTLPENADDYGQLVFFAAGSGIGPIYSLIKTCLKINKRIRLLLVYSNHSVRSTIFYKELVRLRHEHSPQLQVEFLFSNAFFLHNARLTPESMDDILKDHGIELSSSVLFYLCGPAGYMRMINFKLQTLGIKPTQIKREIFKIEKPSKTLIPPDTKPYLVTVSNGTQRHQFPVQYPVTILAAAKKLKIPLSFSCETGQCGTCAADCVKGQVWMSNNEVLLDEELAKGKILTCTGFPIHGDVELNMPF